MRWFQAVILCIAATATILAGFIPEWDMFDPDRPLAPAFIVLEGIADEASAVYAVERRPTWTQQPDTVLAMGLRSSGAWVFQVAYCASNPWREVQLQTPDSILFTDLRLLHGDTLIIQNREGTHAFAGNAGAWNRFYQAHLAYTDLGAVDEDGQPWSEARLDRVLLSRQHALVDTYSAEFSGRPDSSYNAYALASLVNRLFLSWAAERVSLLKQDGHSVVPAGEEALDFINDIPWIEYGRDRTSTALLDYVRDCYFQQVSVHTADAEPDTGTLQRTMDLIEQHHVSAMRRALELSVVQWVVERRYSDAYSLVRKWMNPRAGYHLPREYFVEDPLTSLMDRVEAGNGALRQ